MPSATAVCVGPVCTRQYSDEHFAYLLKIFELLVIQSSCGTTTNIVQPSPFDSNDL